MSQDRKDHETVWELIKECRFGMLSHRHADGSLHSHPLTTQNRKLEADGILYFFVSRASEVGQRLQEDGNVSVSYVNIDKDTYVSVTGHATVNDDLAKKKELFNPFAKAWFPGGPEDPDLELVEVQIHQAEYWDVQQSKLRQVITMLRAAATGKRPGAMGDHKEVQFQS